MDCLPFVSTCYEVPLSLTVFYNTVSVSERIFSTVGEVDCNRCGRLCVLLLLEVRMHVADRDTGLGMTVIYSRTCERPRFHPRFS